MGFCDGSVRFIKSTINSWSFSQGNADQYGDSVPDGISFNASTMVWTVNPGTSSASGRHSRPATAAR